MANVLTRNIWNCDSLGILSTGPVFVKAIMHYPTANAEAFELKWWDEDTPAITVRGITYTITTSTDDTVTDDSAAAFTSAFADGNVVRCLKTTGSDAGVYGLIKTVGNNARFVTHLSPYTAEAHKVGDWACYTTYTALKGIQTADADERSMWYPFPGERGFEFPNLALDSLSAGSIQIYLG
jgi:hypothetical protein